MTNNGQGYQPQVTGAVDLAQTVLSTLSVPADAPFRTVVGEPARLLLETRDQDGVRHSPAPLVHRH